MSVSAKINRVPPQNIEMEMMILGAIMLEPQGLAYRIAADALTPESFYLTGHGIVFEVMGELVELGKPPDVEIVIDVLKARGLLEKVGGANVILSMLNAVPSAASIEVHVRQIAEKSIGRAYLRVLTRGVEEIYRQELDLAEIFGMVADATNQLTGEIAKGQAITMVEAIGKSYDGIMAREVAVRDAKEKGKPLEIMRGVPTGFTDLDAKLGGLRPRELTIAAGATSMGKTTFALEVAFNAAHEAGVPTVIYSLEMGADELADRLLSMQTLTSDAGKLTGLPSQRLDTPDLSDWDHHILNKARARLERTPLYIRVPPRLNIRDLRAMLRADKANLGIGLAIVDYLGLIDPGTSEGRRYEQMTAVSNGLKGLARELAISLLVPHQLSRAPADRGNKRPMLSDLRDSGAIEQDADCVIGLYREDYYRRQQGLEPAGQGMPEAEVIVLKNRNGPTGKVLMYFYESLTRFIPKARKW